MVWTDVKINALPSKSDSVYEYLHSEYRPHNTVFVIINLNN